MRLKDIETQLRVVKFENTTYKAYNPEENSGKTQVYRYLGLFNFDSKRGVATFDGVEYKELNALVEALYKYADSLPFHSDYYDPSYRIGVKESFCFRDHLKSLGFVENYQAYKGDLYILYNGNELDKSIAITLSINIEDDSTHGTICQYHNDGSSWTNIPFENLEDGIKKINSLLAIQTSMMVSTLFKISEQCVDDVQSLNESTVSTLTKKMTIETQNFNEVMIERLEKILKTLKGE